jgi:hypothetical protein
MKEGGKLMLAGTRSSVPFRRLPDFFGDGGVYETTAWISFTLFGQFGHGKNAGG